MSPNEPLTIRNPGSLAQCSRLLAAVTLVGGIVVSLGWQFRVPLLRGDFMGTFIGPNAALLLILFGSSLLLQQRTEVFSGRLGLALGFAVLGIAGTVLAEHATGKYLYIDRLYMAHRLSDWYVAFPIGRIALPTSIAFVLAGVGLTAYRRPRLGWLSDASGVAILAISYLSLIGYAYGISRFYGRVMALPTALLLIAVGVAILTARTKGGVAETLIGREAGSLGSLAFAIESEARQVISNLILNAIDAAPANSTITLIVDDDKPGTVRLAVEDRGQGVSDESFGRIFEPFFTTKETGTGLGLWVSQDLLKRNGGSLVLESRRHPTRFSAYFKAGTVTKTISA